MIELPEARVIARGLRREIVGKKIMRVGGNYTDHKFTWYEGEPNTYENKLVGKKVTKIVDRNFYVEIEIEDYVLYMRDGANVRYYAAGHAKPEKSKLLLEFEDGSFVNVTVQMYACIGLYKKGVESGNEYYVIELNGVGALDERFDFDYFKSLLDEKTSKLSVKGFLATGQRILGIGNGVVQDIMFNAGLHPKRKMNTLSEEEVRELYEATVGTLNEMIDGGGRDTEKNIYGEEGGYHTILSSKSYKDGCPKCGSAIKKEQYLGGSIYYCPVCQK